MSRPAVVITAVAAVTPLGLSAEQSWRGVLTGASALGPMSALEQPTPQGKGGYQAVDLPADFEPHLTREVRYLRRTIQDALRPFGPTLPYPPHRCGVVLGTTLHGMRSGGAFLRSGDFAHLQHFLAAAVLREATAGLPIAGDAVTTCSACSSSLGAVALGVTLLETGQLDLVIAGGYDAASEYAYGGFNALRLVADGPPRPFARDRTGMKLGEGYAVVVLERAADIGTRRPLATLLGYGESADAHHLTQPHPAGRGAAMAVSAALARAVVSPAEVDLIAAHATATPDNDAGESAALSAVFGPDLPNVPVVAFKSHVGHTLGGAGAVELVLSSLALRDGVVPPTAHTTAAAVDFAGLKLATGDPRAANIRRTLNTSLGFGGANTAMVLSRDPAPPGSPALLRDVFITGVGVLLSPTEAELLPLLNARRARRLNDYVKLTLAATALALSDAGLTGSVPSDTAVLLGTTHGSTGYAADYYRQVVAEGLGAANPILFAEGVPNAGAAHVSLAHGLTGACQTLIGSRTAGLDALRLASLRIANGDWDRAVVGAAEERHATVDDAYRHAGRRVTTVAASVTLILESRASIDARHGRPRGIVTATAAASGGARPALRSVLRRLGRPVRPTRTEVDAFAAGPLLTLAAALSTATKPFTVAIAGEDGTAAGVSVGVG